MLQHPFISYHRLTIRECLVQKRNMVILNRIQSWLSPHIQKHNLAARIPRYNVL
jgi:hypothetical protein